MIKLKQMGTTFHLRLNMFLSCYQKCISIIPLQENFYLIPSVHICALIKHCKKVTVMLICRTALNFVMYCFSDVHMITGTLVKLHKIILDCMCVHCTSHQMCFSPCFMNAHGYICADKTPHKKYFATCIWYNWLLFLQGVITLVIIKGGRQGGREGTERSGIWLMDCGCSKFRL